MPVKKVLVVSYAYPPIAGIRAIPITKIVKYLEEFGWTPIVLTVRNPDPLLDKINPDFFEEEDYKDIRTVRTYCFSLGLIFGGIEKLWRSIRAIMVPDIYVGWIPHSISVAKKIIEEENVDVILCPIPPAVNIVIGALLKRMTGRSLILDYRDIELLWFPTELHAWTVKKIHEWILKLADFVIVVNPSQKRNMLKLYPFLDVEKVRILENPFDPDDFKGVKPVRYRKFTILYTGGIFKVPSIGVDRVAPFRVFAEATSNLVQEGVLDSSRFQVVIIGWIDSSVKNIVRELALENIITYKGVKSHKEAIEHMLGADVLLIIPGGEIFSPTKLFEYLASRKFILNIGSHQGEVSKVIKAANCGVTVSPNIEEFKDILPKIIAGDFIRDIRCKSTLINRFSAKELAKRLVEIMNSSVS